MDLFSQPTRAWFLHAFGEPTEAQARAWPAIASGSDALVIAPTGSGKTLAAFLWSIDRLMAGACRRRLPAKSTGGGRSDAQGVSVLYISPLKALAVDVAKNLLKPLDGIATQCESIGLPAPNVIVATRSGDTPPAERRRIAAHPPDILVTTPESLYLMLTSKARSVLSHVDTVIVDEVHALAGTKRGAHLALSLERLDALAESSRVRGRAQRIGLSATVRPADEVARFLSGGRPVEIVDAGETPEMDLKVVEPLSDMRDLSSANVKHRAGGVEGMRADEAPISGVTPAMRRLAARHGMVRRRGLNGGDGDGIGYQAMTGVANRASCGEGRSGSVNGRSGAFPTSAIVGAAGDGMGGMGAAVDGEGAMGVGVNAADASGGSIWPVIERNVLDDILAHHTTLVFVNSRGLAEKLTARLNDLYASAKSSLERTVDASDLGRNDDSGSPEGREGFARHYDAVVGSTTMLVGSHGPSDVIAMAHHGSVSKDRRKRIEEDLKAGRLRCVVATSSLELGIDMGSVDLVIQIAPPLSVASGLQRVGRADHRVGGVSHALFYPLTREHIIDVAASIEAMRAGEIEPLAMPRNPLDILAQQTVAAAAMGDLAADEWYARVRRAAPFTSLTRDDFDAVMGMLTGAYNDEDFSAFRPPLMIDEETGMISARPGAARLAVTSGGTIPDRGLYTVVLPEADAGKGPRRVGELDEEMVYESRVGDVITLGTSTWQIQEITRDRVVVTPAPGRTARLPFWHGDGAGRDVTFGRVKGRFLREISASLVNPHPAVPSECNVPSVVPNDLSVPPVILSEGRRPQSKDLNASSLQPPRFDSAAETRLRADGLDDNGIANLARLLSEQRAATGAIPSDTRIIIECCPDEESDWRLIIHSPYGRRVHEPWAMAITRRIRARYGFDGQTYAADDGIVIRMPAGQIPGLGSPDGTGRMDSAAFAMLRSLICFDPEELTRDIASQVGETVLFAARFRECAARSLFLPRAQPGKRVPLWQQRLRAAQLLNAARTKRNFPLLLETARECLEDVYDLPALRSLMRNLNEGTATLEGAVTDQPSPMAENLLFGYVGQVMYQYDVPQAERNAQLLSVDPAVLERMLGTDDLADVLDPEVIAQVERELSEREFWNELDADDVTGRVIRYAKTHGPFTADTVIHDLALPAEPVIRTLDELCAKGDLMRGRFAVPRLPLSEGVPCGGTDQYLHKEVFRRIRARSLRKARAAIQPVEPSAYQTFLFDRQGIDPGGGRHEGADGLMRVIEQLEGVALPPDVWESSVFPARVRDYRPAMLDELIAAGEVIWVGSGDAKPGAAGLVAFHPADSALLGGDSAVMPGGGGARVEKSCPSNGEAGKISPLASLGRNDGGNVTFGRNDRGNTAFGRNDRGSAALGRNDKRAVAGVGTLQDAVLDVLSGGGAYRADQLADLTRRRWEEIAPEVNPDTGEIMSKPWSGTQFEQALWSLVWQGKVTNGSFASVRAFDSGSKRAVRAPARASRRRVRIASPALSAPMGGLWMAVEAPIRCVDEATVRTAEIKSDADTSGMVNGDSGETVAIHVEQARVETVLAQVEALLDRYDVIAQPLVEQEGIPGGFSALYPVLRSMEQHGVLVRGMFVQGFGAAQFASKDTVDVLRRFAKKSGAPTGGLRAGAGTESVIAISSLDPASLAGGAVPWPRAPESTAKPARRAGGVVVFTGGIPVAYASAKSKHLTIFDSSGIANDGVVAIAALAENLRRVRSGSIVFVDVNGEPLTIRNLWVPILRQAGFVPSPQGMTCYA